jgi:hypothetical protein
VRLSAPNLARQFPDLTLIDIETYADVFQAIADAIARADGWEPSPSDYEKVGTVMGSGEMEGELFEVEACRTPTMAVRVPNTVRLCIGLLQFHLWRSAIQWRGSGAGPLPVQLPDVQTLLNRKLHPTIAEGADLAAFLTPPSHDGTGYDEPLACVLRFIERQFEPPVPRAIAAHLVESKRRIGQRCQRYCEAIRQRGARPQTKRFDQWVQRIDRLIG